MVYFYVGLGGIIGSLLRYSLAIIAVDFWGKGFPLGTLIINLSGAFLLGWITTHFVFPKKLHPYFLTALTTGVIGSYTTFSTFCLETVHLIEANEDILALLYILSSFLGGLFFVKLGSTIGEKGKREMRRTT
ncbi:fluoride efflux transporter CrcB [Neobacillus sp.]|uniref:fluoride efflux transporter CrcB n=1 Tax=Neobacillus sp. TaxID=2675273 RepID=UPI002899E98D|nr:fluoride efflux transporter CrcB [Neobacillus sp.]